MSPVSYVAAAENGDDVAAISEQFVRAGVAAVNFLSDVVVNHKLPSKDGFGILHSTKTCMVDLSRVVSGVRSTAHVKRSTAAAPRQSPEAKPSRAGAKSVKSPPAQNAPEKKNFARAPRQGVGVGVGIVERV